MFYLSNMPHPYADHLERANAFVADFLDGIFSARVGLMKPNAAIFELAEQRFGLVPADTLFIDDHAGNVEAARARGLAGGSIRRCGAVQRRGARAGLVISVAATPRRRPGAARTTEARAARSTRRPADSGTGSARSGLARSATAKLKV
jgi:beta-phosphoglucomutase-like phosphatase (HAD superfamily)